MSVNSLFLCSISICESELLKFFIVLRHSTVLSSITIEKIENLVFCIQICQRNRNNNKHLVIIIRTWYYFLVCINTIAIYKYWPLLQMFSQALILWFFTPLSHHAPMLYYTSVQTLVDGTSSIIVDWKIRSFLFILISCDSVR